jgi:hypothetical protein
MHRLLESVAGNFEYTFCLDGRYHYLKEDEYFANPLSTDGSRELIDCYSDKNVFLIDKPDLSESEKREAYIEIARQYGADVILTLDSDEWVWFARWEAFRLECYQKMIVRHKGLWNIYNIATKDSQSSMDRPRLWFRPWELAYGKAHYLFYRKDDPTKQLISMGGDKEHFIDHICLQHKDDLRDVEHRFAHERWEKKQQELEDHVLFGKDFSGLKKIKHAV